MRVKRASRQDQVACLADHSNDKRPLGTGDSDTDYTKMKIGRELLRSAVNLAPERYHGTGLLTSKAVLPSQGQSTEDLSESTTYRVGSATVESDSLMPLVAQTE